jgi:hypothetical protein
MENHTVRTAVFSFDKLRNLRALDYNGEFLSNLTYDQVHTRNEPPKHKWELKDSIAREGFRQPAILLNRKNEGNLIIVEGHHRTKVALDEKIPLPVEVHICFCPPASLDYFGLCKVIIKACQRQNNDAEKIGWKQYNDK